MSKFDASRDYYADLELPLTADSKDIKAQYKKLALKYHPDRNRGHEAEVNAKFQLIQAAHEVLSNPDLRAQYDAKRNRSRYPTASGVKGNPWQDVSSQFQPPPRRNPSTRKPPNSGARFQNFPSNVPPPTAKKPQTDDEARWDRFRAFSGMKSSSHRPPPPSPGKRTDSRRSEAANGEGPPPAVPPRTPGQQQRADAAFGNRKSTYGARPAYATDEAAEPRPYPSARPTSNLFEETAASARRRRAASHTDQDYLRDNILDPRQRTPYQTHGGEKFNPFEGVPVAQSKSNDEGNMGDAEDNTPRGRRASMAKNTRGSRSHQDLKVPAGEEWRPRSSQESNARFAEPSPSRAKDRYTPTGANGTAGSTDESDGGTYKAKNRPSVFSFGMSDEYVNTPSTPDPTTFARSSADDISTRFANDENSATWKFSAGGDETAERSPTMRSHSGSRLGRRSPVKRPSMRRAHVSDDATANEPTNISNVSANANANANRADAGTPGFDAEAWRQKLGPEVFAPTQAAARPQSPIKATRRDSRKTTRTVRPTVGSAGLVSDESLSASGGDDAPPRSTPGHVSAEPVDISGLGSPNAMDIDTPTPEPLAAGVPGTKPATPTPEAAAAAGSRKVNLEPSRPEWRAGTGHVNGSAATNKGSEDSDDFRASFAEFNKVAPFASQGPGMPGLGSEGLGGSFVSDLKSQLPFESRAASRPPLDSFGGAAAAQAAAAAAKKAQMEFPKPPKAPTPPAALGVVGLKASRGAWNKYVTDWQMYVYLWDEFDGQVADLFAQRKEARRREREEKGLEFLGALGDGGCIEYLAGVEADNEVRYKWHQCGVAHAERVKEFMAYRERMK